MDKIRRYDLDWLRVIVFGLLIFYHVGMFFVPWGWHIKNNEIYRWLQYPMIFLNQWRLPILFVISGMGTAYALSFRSKSQFMKERFIRLFIPLVFGILLIVPPQVYIERLVNGQFEGSYLSFIVSGSFFQGIYPSGNFSWHHLWFLPYLLVFSLIMAPVFVKLRNNPGHKLLTWLRAKISQQPYFLFAFIIPLYIIVASLKPFFSVTYNLVWDWYNFTLSLALFFYGFLLISIKEVFWKAVHKIWKPSMIIGAVTFSLLLMIWSKMERSTLVHFLESLVQVSNLWAWIITIFGLAAIYLNKPSRYLAYANQAVYPFYILHQTVTVVIGYYIYSEPWTLFPKFMILTVGTFGISFLIYEVIIRRTKLFWPVFGLKSRSEAKEPLNALYKVSFNKNVENY